MLTAERQHFICPLNVGQILYPYQDIRSNIPLLKVKKSLIPSKVSLTISPYTPQGVYCEIYPSLGGNIERVKSQYSIFQNDILYYRVILAFKGIFLPEKSILQDKICCPSAVNKFSFKRTYYSIFGKECLIFGNIICCPFIMQCLAPYTVPLGPRQLLFKKSFTRQNKPFILFHLLISKILYYM